MPEATPTNPKKAVFIRRTASTLGLWGVVTAAFASRQAWAYLGLVGILTILATLEYFRMLRAAGMKSFPRFGLLLAVAYSLALFGFLGGWIHGAPGVFPEKPVPDWLDTAAIFVALAGAFTLQLRHEIRGQEPIQAVAANVLGFVYIPFLFSFAAKVVFLTPARAALPGWESVPSAMLLMWLLAVTKFTDMGAYLTGSLIGRHKMIPHVSPGKTWEGFFGALFFAQLAGCGLYAKFPELLRPLASWTHVIVLGFLLALLAVVGDLAESVVKRSLGAKDSGNMLPGIGGALDLIDSLCFTAPALYLYLQWVHR
jgi:phosphatidate cytidylyltransferase